ncbi:hypothetical protein [Streptomyces sp. NBC_00233]|uniref:hypothetical protein n=1 Tax=Streptomyces sp. NBC_00233 TaxID=2975686 RepID=UPI00224D71C7|nr:hypothetical protein [Streptomyces sp. NBC_00233]MCX5229650.1 hypothetical protein [Streptomyces sp. NBC_00233]
MDASDAPSLHESMRKHGISGLLQPVDPQDRAGAWQVVDPADQRDITEYVLARVAAADQQPPKRGFVIAG